MYKRIITEKTPLSEKVKKIITYYRVNRGATISWKRRHKNVVSLNPKLGRRLKKHVEQSHRLYWQPLNKNIKYDTLRICGNLSGIADYRIIPEEVFRVDIEPSLNRDSFASFYSNKSYYDLWCPGGIFPKSYLHNLDGVWLDSNFNRISMLQIESIASTLPYPVVVKPNKDSHGGSNIYFVNDAEELLTIIEHMSNVLVQEKIKQHHYFAQFNSKGINSLRVYVYRSVVDNRLHILKTALRMGKGGSLDNETAGGIVTFVKGDGYLNGFALDKYGVKYFSHPDTKADFISKIPDYFGLTQLAINVASKIFYARLIGLDMCYDDRSNWRLLEVNLDSATIRFAQYHGSLFFGDFTEEVRDYCIANHWILGSSNQ